MARMLPFMYQQYPGMQQHIQQLQAVQQQQQQQNTATNHTAANPFLNSILAHHLATASAANQTHQSRFVILRLFKQNIISVSNFNRLIVLKS